MGKIEARLTYSEAGPGVLLTPAQMDQAARDREADFARRAMEQNRHMQEVLEEQHGLPGERRTGRKTGH